MRNSKDDVVYLLYLDESGNERDANDRYFVLAGIALFERQTYYLSEQVEDIQNRYFPNTQPITFHLTEIRAKKGLWRKTPESVRQAVIEELINVIVNAPNQGRLLYAAAVEKNAILWSERAVEAATEQICKRFDNFLTRSHREGNTQRGLLVFAEGRFDKRAKVWVHNFRQQGTTWGSINNLADIPYFASMQESRLLQLADLVAHAVWLLYEKRDPQLIRPLLPHFDPGAEGTLHGLVHIGDSRGNTCDCPACASRRTPGSFGNWITDP